MIYDKTLVIKLDIIIRKVETAAAREKWVQFAKVIYMYRSPKEI